MKTTLTEMTPKDRHREPARNQELGTAFMFGLRVGAVHLFVDAANVSGVLALEPTTRVPHAPPHIVGLAPHGEGALAIADLGQFLQLDDVQPDRYAVDMSTYRVVIVTHSNMEAGLLCDQALGVRALERARMEPASILRGGRLTEFIREEIDCDDARFGVLDLGALLNSARIPSDRSN
jgi:chemotaxis signal transduction protein